MSQENYGECPDEKIVEAILKDDHAAFKILFYRYYKALIRFAWFRVHSMDTSRDLVQELFFRVWKNRKNLDSAKSIKAYLYRSLTNLIINHVNLSSSQMNSLENVDDEKNLSGESEVEFDIDFKTALEGLPEKLKTVYVLSRVEGYKYAEIAEVCGISVKAVEKRMSQAFVHMKKFFSKK